MPEPKRTTRSNQPTTPEDFPTRPPAGQVVDYNTDTALKLGRLLEAVDSLKVSVKEQGDKLKEQGEKLTELVKEIHGYKQAFGVVKVVILALIGAIGWLIKLYVDLNHSSPK
jgi:hypothetical protein